MNAPEIEPTAAAAAIRPAFWKRPDLFLGLAVSGGAGILAADWIDPAPWTALGVFLLVALAWALRRGAPWCAVAVAAGFGALHAFALHGIPEEALARQLRAEPTRVRATGAVLDEPRWSASGETARFTLGLERIEVNGRAWPSHARVLAQWQNGNPRCGDRLELIGLGSNLPGPRNPGEFDYAGYERRQGIRSEIRARGGHDVRVAGRETGASLRRIAGRFHDWMRDSLHLGIAPQTPGAAIISTMLLGLRDDPGLGELEEAFQRTGTLHYFAIDGLKLAILSCLALFLMQRAGVPRGWARTLSLPPLVFYAMATGLGPASVRATLTGGMLIGAFWVERPPRPLNLLGAAAALILLADTNQLFELGFQLTFLVVLALIVAAGWLHRRLAPLGAPDAFLPPRLYSPARRAWEAVRLWALGLVSVSLVAWLGSLPIMILYFHVISPVSPLANVATFPLAWSVLTLGVAVLCAAALPGLGWLAAAFNHVNLWAAHAFLAAVHFFDAWTGGSFYVTAPSLWTLRAPPAAELTVLDAGRARAIHLRAGGRDWLIDSAQPYEYQHSVKPYLHARGVDQLDGFLLTQADTHHLGAAPLAWSDFHPRRVVDSSPLPGRSPRRQEFLRLLESNRQPVEILRQGASLPLAPGAELRALYPPPGLKAGTSADRALVLQLRADGWRILLLADAGEDVQRWLVAHVPAGELLSDGIVTGAAGPAEPEFLRVVHPKLVVSQAVDALPGTIGTREHGAVSLQMWPGRLEASGFVDGWRRTLRASPSTPPAPAPPALPPPAPY